MDDPQPALTLAIEISNPTSGGQPGVALGWTWPGGVSMLGVEAVGAGGRHDDELMPAVDRLFRRCGQPPGGLGRIVVSAGPGGYTGLRIATAAANLLGLGTGAGVVSVPSAWVAAALVPRGEPFVVCLASKGESTVGTMFSALGEPVSGPTLLDAAMLSGSRLVVADGYLGPGLRRAVEASGGVVIPPDLRAESCLGLAWSQPAGPMVLPLYGREAEAVTQWRARELSGGRPGRAGHGGEERNPG
jgi:tRNA A37 threonylcarbamoyladenosine modification protein TsaB